MSDKLFNNIVGVLIASGLILTLALGVYTIHLYKSVSILTFIANEVW